MKIQIYTDGGFSYHETIGSWAYIISIPEKSSATIENYALVDHHKQTSQVAEIMAILKALTCCYEGLAKSNDVVSKSLEITLYSDSMYCVNSTNDWMHGWQKRDWQVDKQNLDLWKQIFVLKSKFRSVKLVWVKGHAGIELNERVDQLTQIPLEKYRK